VTRKYDRDEPVPGDQIIAREAIGLLLWRGTVFNSTHPDCKERFYVSADDTALVISVLPGLGPNAAGPRLVIHVKDRLVLAWWNPCLWNRMER
jgi:hypothetical protein